MFALHINILTISLKQDDLLSIKGKVKIILVMTYFLGFVNIVLAAWVRVSSRCRLLIGGLPCTIPDQDLYMPCSTMALTPKFGSPKQHSYPIVTIDGS